MTFYTYKEVETFLIYSIFVIFITFIYVCIFTFIEIDNEFLRRLNKHTYIIIYITFYYFD